MNGYSIVRENATTAQVVAALTRHPTWRAEANASEEFTIVADVCGSHVGATRVRKEPRPFPVIDFPGLPGSIPLRSDWTICRPKRVIVKVGHVTNGCVSIGGENTVLLADRSKRYELFAREVE